MTVFIFVPGGFEIASSASLQSFASKVSNKMLVIYQ